MRPLLILLATAAFLQVSGKLAADAVVVSSITEPPDAAELKRKLAACPDGAIHISGTVEVDNVDCSLPPWPTHNTSVLASCTLSYTTPTH
jgi:hypothetical protein